MKKKEENKIFSKIIPIIVGIIIIFIILWLYPLKMKKNNNGEYNCYNIFGYNIQCND